MIPSWLAVVLLLAGVLLWFVVLKRWAVWGDHPLFGNLSTEGAVTSVVVLLIVGLPVRMLALKGVERIPWWGYVLIAIIAYLVGAWGAWHYRKRHPKDL